jgi:RNA polymerase sigma-70 factor (ECF subfamily)
LNKKVPDKNKNFFVDMVYSHMGIIYKICNLYASVDDREDLKQEIIYQLWQSYPSFRGDSKFQSWMYRVALNTAMLGLRARRIKYAPLNELNADISEEISTESSEADKIRQLYRHIAKLKDLDKTIIFLYLEECSYEEIAEITGINIKTVSVRLVRIRKKLRELFNIQNDGTL